MIQQTPDQTSDQTPDPEPSGEASNSSPTQTSEVAPAMASDNEAAIGGTRQASDQRLRFAVLQIGARMHYAVPALLERAEMLCHFYTDAIGNRGVTGALATVVPQWMWPPPIRRLIGRQVP